MQHIKRVIGDHGVIGDMRTCALIADDGTIDYFCWPDLDSSSVFSALLHDDSAGHFSLTPAWKDTRRYQRYLPESNILVTRWLGPEGIAELIDFMPLCQRQDKQPHIVRWVKMISGEGCFSLRCAPVHDYARADTQARLCSNRVTFSATGQPALCLSASHTLAVEGAVALASFTLKAGENASFIFGCAGDDLPTGILTEQYFRETLHFWQSWSGKSHYQGRWREMVNRSALVLKLLTSREHGSIAAAATFGLPEAPGGVRNWDYRATWIRDASFSMYALMRLGYTSEAREFTQWVSRCVENTHQQKDKLQVMYRLDSSSELHESVLNNLRGYADSSPVRTGNDAWQQTQLDIYGELMDAIYLANKYGEAISCHDWNNVRHMMDYVCSNWHQPDAGIWEMRGEPQHFLHSRLMCWVALDRAMRLGQKRSLPVPYQHWDRVRSEIHADIWSNFWDQQQGHFTAIRHGKSVDASMLLMPLVRFISATDPQWLATLSVIKKTLISDGMVRRYNIKETPADGLQGQEGAFVACSFWYVECLARAERLEEAQIEFEKLLSYANPLGLYAEEMDTRGYPLGNFPQALSHLALISAAFSLDRKLSKKQQLWQP